MFANFKTFMVDGHKYDARNEYYKFSAGKLMCTACNKSAVSWRNRKSHAVAASHKENKEKILKLKEKQQSLVTDHVAFLTANGMQDQTLPAEDHSYRLQIASMMCKSNIAFTCIAPMEETLKRISGGMSSGGPCGLVDQVPFLLLIFDGSPFFADALAVKLRGVDKNTWEVKEILVKCDLFDSSLDSDGLVGAIL